MLADAARKRLAAPSPKTRPQSLAAAAEAGSPATAAERDAWLQPSQAEGLAAAAEAGSLATAAERDAWLQPSQAEGLVAAAAVQWAAAARAHSAPQAWGAPRRLGDHRNRIDRGSRPAAARAQRTSLVARHRGRREPSHCDSLAEPSRCFGHLRKAGAAPLAEP